MTHGNIESAYCIIDSETCKPIEFGKIENKELAIAMRFAHYNNLAIEMVASYGMPVGETVFETCVWIGKFIQIAEDRFVETVKIYRKDEKMNLCHSMKAKDSNIRQALIDRFGEVGTKKKPRLVLWI